jgi:hypothetical protein
MVTDVRHASSSSSSVRARGGCDKLSRSQLCSSVAPQLDGSAPTLGPIRRWVIHSMLYPTTYVLSLQQAKFLTSLIVQDINGGWSKLGSGSFGNVYKGTRRCYETPQITP